MGTIDCEVVVPRAGGEEAQGLAEKQRRGWGSLVQKLRGRKGETKVQGAL